MGILPHKPSKDDGPPPIVVYWRDVIRASRIGRFIARHKTASAAVAALYALTKVWKWLIVDLIRWGTHPDATFHWAAHHALLAGGLSLAAFLVFFAISRFGLDWLDLSSEEEAPKDDRWHHRHRPANHHANTHVPGR